MIGKKSPLVYIDNIICHEWELIEASGVELAPYAYLTVHFNDGLVVSYDSSRVLVKDKRS